MNDVLNAEGIRSILSNMVTKTCGLLIATPSVLSGKKRIKTLNVG